MTVERLLTDNPVIVSIVFAYFLGTLSGARLVARLWLNSDITESGSGNPGATNIYRHGGLIPAVTVFFLDAGKGAAAVFIAKTLLGLDGLYLLFPAFSAMAGHIYPLFGLIKGGKGVSTAAGILVVLNWIVFLLGLICFFLVFAVKKTASVASLLSSLCVLTTSTIFTVCGQSQGQTLLFTLIVVVILSITHRHNIRRILSGKEPETHIKEH